MNEHTASTSDSAAVFADLCDYTRITEELGDAAAAQMALALGEIAAIVARRHSGRVVKMLGDGAHLHFSDRRHAVSASIELIDLVRGSGLPCARVGVNAGPMIEANGDYYGRTVNIAARIAAQATPGTVVVGESAMTTADAAVRYEALGPVALRGVAQQINVYRATAVA